MASLQDKFTRLDDAKALLESLVTDGIDLQSDLAIARELELIHAFEDLASEFSPKIPSREVPSGKRA